MLERITYLWLCVSLCICYCCCYVFLNYVFLFFSFCVCCYCLWFFVLCLFGGDVLLNTYAIEAIKFSDLSMILVNLWKTYTIRGKGSRNGSHLVGHFGLEQSWYSVCRSHWVVSVWHSTVVSIFNQRCCGYFWSNLLHRMLR